MKKNQGFTLVEILVALAIVIVLAAIASMVVLNFIDRARIAAGRKLETQIVRALRDELVGEWTFDDGTANDSSGSGHDGTFENGAITIADCKYGACLALDGIDDFVDIPQDINLLFDKKLTISAWIQPLSLTDENTYIDFNFGRMAYCHLVGCTGQTGIYYLNLEYEPNTIDAPVVGSLDVGAWHHIALSYNGKFFTGYLDGKEVVREISTLQIRQEPFQLRLGRRITTTDYAHALIDNVRIYKDSFDL